MGCITLRYCGMATPTGFGFSASMANEPSFTTQSDRIKALCEEAMKAPEITITEKTFDASDSTPYRGEASRLKVAARTQVEPDPVESPAEPTPAAATEKPAPVQHTEQDGELAAMLEEREGRLAQRSGRARLLANVALMVLIVAPAVTVAVHPGLRTKFEKTLHHLGQGVDDVKTLANTKESFDKALEEVAVHGDHIDSATKMLGVDPSSVGADDDLEMTSEMRQLMGDEADGFGTRRNKLQAMGNVASAVTGMEQKGRE
jgi:hypothetical protein